MPFTAAHKANPNAGQNNTAMNIRATQVAASLVKGERYVLVRKADSVAAADAGPWNAATWAPDTYGISCDGYETVLITAKFSGAGSLKVVPMIFDPDTALWMAPIVGGSVVESDAIDGSGNQVVEMRVFGEHVVFFRISSVTGGPLTNVEIAVKRGRPRGVAYLG